MENDEVGPDIPPPPPPEGIPPERETKSRQDDHRERAQRRRDDLINEDYEQDIKARKEYADKLYGLIKYWLIGIGFLIVFQGFTVDFVFFSTPSDSLNFKDYFPISFSLSDKVLIAILTGTTINVLGLFLVVARYFYKSKDSEKKNNSE